MSTYAGEFTCPNCGTVPRRICLDENGIELSEYHLERLALAADINMDQETAKARAMVKRMLRGIGVQTPSDIPEDAQFDLEKLFTLYNARIIQRKKS